MWGRGREGYKCVVMRANWKGFSVMNEDVDSRVAGTREGGREGRMEERKKGRKE